MTRPAGPAPAADGRRKRIAARAGATFLLAAGLAASAAGPGLAAPADDIRARMEAWTDAFNAGGGAGLCDLYAKDAVAEFRGQPERDFDAICAQLLAAVADPARRFHYALAIREIMVAGDIAVVRRTWTLFITPLNVTTVEPGMDVFRRDPDGAWRIVRSLAYEE